jgi:3'(2'), 5'-bisphosphate nucleotidase
MLSFLAGPVILIINNDTDTEFSVELKDGNILITIAVNYTHEVIMQHLDKTGIPIFSEEGKTIPY